MITAEYEGKVCTFRVTVAEKTLGIRSRVHSVTDTLVERLPGGITLSELISGLYSPINVSVYDMNGQKLTAGYAKLGTGMKIRLFTVDGDMAEELTLSVFGDADGDGTVTTSDARIALRAAARLDTLTEAQAAAVEVDGDRNGISTSDARILLRVAARLETLPEAIDADPPPDEPPVTQDPLTEPSTTEPSVTEPSPTEGHTRSIAVAFSSNE